MGNNIFENAQSVVAAIRAEIDQNTNAAEAFNLTERLERAEHDVQTLRARMESGYPILEC